MMLAGLISNFVLLVKKFQKKALPCLLQKHLHSCTPGIANVPRSWWNSKIRVHRIHFNCDFANCWCFQGRYQTPADEFLFPSTSLNSLPSLLPKVCQKSVLNKTRPGSPHLRDNFFAFLESLEIRYSFRCVCVPPERACSGFQHFP